MTSLKNERTVYHNDMKAANEALTFQFLVWGVGGLVMIGVARFYLGITFREMLST